MEKIKELTNLEKLDEMDNQLDQAIGNAKKVINQQKDLIEILNASKKKKSFEMFIKELETGIVKYEEQIKGLEEKKALILMITKSCKDSEGYTELFNEICRLFGIFR